MATIVELLHLYYDMMISVLNMTEVVKLQLYPLTPERAFLVHGFTNVALEVGFSQLPNYGKRHPSPVTFTSSLKPSVQRVTWDRRGKLPWRISGYVC
jgi:hypothetical protein